MKLFRDYVLRARPLPGPVERPRFRGRRRAFGGGAPSTRRDSVLAAAADRGRATTGVRSAPLPQPGPSVHPCTSTSDTPPARRLALEAARSGVVPVRTILTIAPGSSRSLHASFPNAGAGERPRPRRVSPGLNRRLFHVTCGGGERVDGSKNRRSRQPPTGSRYW